MNAFTSQIALSTDFAGKGYTGRKSTPGNVGNSLFHNFLRKVNNQDDDSALGSFSWIQALEDRVSGNGEVDAGSSGKAGRFLALLEQSAGQLEVPHSDVPALTGVLQELGFSSEEIDTLMLSLTEEDGSIRMDRLLMKLQGMMQEKAESGSSFLVDRSDVNRVEEALFKMGLGASEVRDVVAKASNEDGDLDMRSLTAALSKHFTGVDAGTEEQLTEALRRAVDVDLRPRSLEQIAKDAGLGQAVGSLKDGDASESAREAAKREISLLLQQKGIPAEEVKKFLETLSIGKTESGQAMLRNESTDGVALRQDGGEWQQGEWKEGAIDTLNKGNVPTGREHMREAGSEIGRENDPGKGFFAGEKGSASSTEPAEEIGEVFIGRPGPGKGRLTGAGPAQNQGTASLEGKPMGEVGQTASEAGPGGNQTGEQTIQTRADFSAELSASRAERTSSTETTTGPRASTAAFTLPEPLPKIVDRMVWMVRAGEQTSRIQVTPPDLGRLDMEIVIKQGHLHAQLNAETPAVKELIEANLQQLKQQLNNMGFAVDRFEVTTGLDDRRFSEQQAWTGGRRGRRGQGSRSGAQGGIETAAAGTGHRSTGLYQVDVHV